MVNRREKKGCWSKSRKNRHPDSIQDFRGELGNYRGIIKIPENILDRRISFNQNCRNFQDIILDLKTLNILNRLYLKKFLEFYENFVKIFNIFLHEK